MGNREDNMRFHYEEFTRPEANTPKIVPKVEASPTLKPKMGSLDQQPDPQITNREEIPTIISTDVTSHPVYYKFPKEIGRNKPPSPEIPEEQSVFEGTVYAPVDQPFNISQPGLEQVRHLPKP